MDTTGDGVIAPARMRPTRNATDVDSPTVTIVKRLDMYTVAYASFIISARNSSSVSIGTPNSRAFSSLLPASAPRTR